MFEKEVVAKGEHLIYYVYKLHKYISFERKDDHLSAYSLSGDGVCECTFFRYCSDKIYEKIHKELLFTADTSYYHLEGLGDGISAGLVYNTMNRLFYIIYLVNDKIYACGPKISELKDEDKFFELDNFIGYEM